MDAGGLELKLTDILGDLELGKLTEEYYVDVDLRVEIPASLVFSFGRKSQSSPYLACASHLLALTHA